MFGRRHSGTSDHTASRTILCTVPFNLDISLRDKAIMEIIDLQSVRGVEVGVRGGYYGLWVDFYRFHDTTNKRADLAQIEVIMTELARSHKASSAAQ